jgi:hypothetical protein
MSQDEMMVDPDETIVVSSVSKGKGKQKAEDPIHSAEDDNLPW